MERKDLGAARGFVGIAALALIVSVFLPWTDAAGGNSTAWELNAAVAVLCLFAGALGLVAAITDGRIGLFRPDVSSSGAADIVNVATTIVVATFILADLPSGTGPALGAYLALASAVVVACGSADWRVLRGAPLFPR